MTFGLGERKGGGEGGSIYTAKGGGGAKSLKIDSTSHVEKEGNT